MRNQAKQFIYNGEELDVDLAEDIPTPETESINDSTNKATPLPDDIEKQRPTIWDRLGLSRKKRYCLAAFFNLAIIWASAVSFVIFTPDRYISKFTLLIPGAGAGSSVNLDDLGQATTSVNSAYSSSKVDPKTNYKAIAMSPVVIDLAAKRLGITRESFGKPKVKLIDQTTLLEISLSATESEAAFTKSAEFLAALESTLSQLRSEELSTRRKANERVLSVYRDNVNQAQSAVLAFQRESTIVSPQQFEDLVLNVETIKQRGAESEVKFQSINTSLTDLQASLDIDPQQAAHALKLQNDSVFGSLLIKVAETHAELVEKEAVWGRKHPKVLHARARVNSSRQALLNRAKSLTNIDSLNALDNLYISDEGGRSELFQTVIKLTADKSAAASEIESYNTQLEELESRMHINAGLAATLQDLERTHQVATAIYVSAAAKTDLGNSDIFASYPMTQMLMAPTKPNGPEKFTKPVALAGAAIASLLICLALLISWKRSVLLQKLQKRS